MNDGQLTGLVVLDIKKASDMVNHDILIDKLALYHYSKSTKAWFRSNLTDRKQAVQFNQTMSSERQITSNVPQGSIVEHYINYYC